MKTLPGNTDAVFIVHVCHAEDSDVLTKLWLFTITLILFMCVNVIYFRNRRSVAPAHRTRFQQPNSPDEMRRVIHCREVVGLLLRTHKIKVYM